MKCLLQIVTFVYSLYMYMYVGNYETKKHNESIFTLTSDLNQDTDPLDIFNLFFPDNKPVLVI